MILEKHLLVYSVTGGALFFSQIGQTAVSMGLTPQYPEEERQFSTNHVVSPTTVSFLPI